MASMARGTSDLLREGMMENEKREHDDAYWDSIPEVKLDDSFSASHDAEMVCMFLHSKGAYTTWQMSQMLGVSEGKVRRMLSGKYALRMHDLDNLARVGFEMGALSVFKFKQLVVVPFQDWKFADELVQIARMKKDEEPEPMRPNCPGCAHHEFELMEIKPQNLQTNITVLVCANCGSLCGVLG